MSEKDSLSLRVNKEPSNQNEKLDLEKFELQKDTDLFKISKLIHHHPKFFIIGDIFPTASTHEKNSLLIDSNLESNQSKSYVRARKTKFKIKNINITTNTKFHSTTKFLLCILTCLFLTNLTPIYLKLSSQKTMKTEVPLALTALDVVNWISWSQLYGIISLESNRAVREGWVKNQDLKKYLKGKNFWESTYAGQASSEVWTFSQKAHEKADLMISQFNSPQYFFEIGGGNWAKKKIDVEIFEVNFDEKYREGGSEGVKEEEHEGVIKSVFGISWKKFSVSSLEAIELTTVSGVKYQLRNYENDSLSEIPSLGELRERDNDPFENYFRKLLTGQALKSSIEDVTKFKEFLLEICLDNERVVMFASLGGIGISFGILLFILGFIYNMKKYMMNFYTILLKNRVFFFKFILFFFLIFC